VVARSSTSWGDSGMSPPLFAECQLIRCDPVWHVSSRTDEACCNRPTRLLYSLYIFYVS